MLPQPTAKKSYAGIDATKIVMAFAVLASHSIAFFTVNDYPDALRCFLKFARPFFFFVSGFLLARKLEEAQDSTDKESVLRQRVKQLFRLYFYWLLIYFPLDIYTFATTDDSLPKCLFNYIYGIVFCGESFYAWPLWFIYSMAIVCLIYSRTLYRIRHAMPVLMIFFLLIAFLDWAEVFPEQGIWRIARNICNRVLCGGVYLTAGMLLYSLRRRKHLLTALGIIAVSVSFMLYFLDLPYSRLLGGGGAFMIALNLPIKPGKITRKMRSLSMWIYYLHMYNLFFCDQICHTYHIALSSAEFFLLSGAATLIITLLIVHLQETPSFSWLKKLIK